MRTMLHTAFVFDNVVRLFKKDIDFSKRVEISEDFFIDFFFEYIESKEETINADYDLLEDLCKKCKESILRYEEEEEEKEKEIEEIEEIEEKKIDDEVE